MSDTSNKRFRLGVEKDADVPSEPNSESGPIDDGSVGASPASSSGAAGASQRPEDVAALEELKKKAFECDLFRDELLRARAELDNFRKRMQRERPRWEDQAVRGLIADLLPVVDNFERAIESLESESTTKESLAEGVHMIFQMLRQTLASHGVDEIVALDQLFDPEAHEAVAQADVEDRETGCIVGEQLKGYRHKGVVVRPSRVTVARRVDSQQSEAAKPTSEDEA